MVKTMRYQIIKPIDCDWKTFGKILRDIQYETRQVMNKTIQRWWEWQDFSADYKEKYKEYPKPREIFGLAGISSYCYSELSKKYTKSNTGNLSISIKNATLKWNADFKDVLKGDKSIANFKKDIPIDLHGNNIKLFKENNSFKLKLSLLSKKYAAELNRKGKEKCQIEILINEGDISGKAILERCLTKEYKISASKIVHKKNKWFINLAYAFDINSKSLNKNNILGIDMGIVYPLYMAVHNSFDREGIIGGEIEQFRKQVEKRKWELQRHSKCCGDGRIGHGTKTRIKPLNFARDKIANFRDTTNHKYSRRVIEFAIKNNCGTIQMEDLTGINTLSKFLKNWPYYDLQQKIKYKAEEVGIVFKLINPEYTSQRCSKCGYIDKSNRTTQEKFLCKSCGFEINADYNAALNISNPDIENIIKANKSA